MLRVFALSFGYVLLVRSLQKCSCALSSSYLCAYDGLRTVSRLGSRGIAPCGRLRAEPSQRKVAPKKQANACALNRFTVLYGSVLYLYAYDELRIVSRGVVVYRQLRAYPACHTERRRKP